MINFIMYLRIYSAAVVQMHAAVQIFQFLTLSSHVHAPNTTEQTLKYLLLGCISTSNRTLIKRKTKESTV